MSQSQARAAKRKQAKFDYDGDTYTVNMSDVTLDVLEAAEKNHLVTCIKLLLDDEQYEMYKAKHPLVVDLEPFFQKLWDAIGSGNSSASPSS